MSRFDSSFEGYSRNLAAFSSRRSLLAKLGKIVGGAALLVPVLPVARGRGEAQAAVKGASEESCDYWKYCALGGSLCACCGGSSQQCPVGTEASKLYWVGTCKSANDGQNYIIAYHDCCGQPKCGKCWCSTAEGARPGYTMGLNGEIDWCMGNESIPVYCTTAIVLGRGDG